jgi:hypothetical protein
MKILHVIYSLRNDRAERIVVDLAKGLKSKMNTDIICTISPIFLSFNQENKKEPIDIKLLDYFSNIGAKIERAEMTLHKDFLP